jgi:hypothetical protein
MSDVPWSAGFAGFVGLGGIFGSYLNARSQVGLQAKTTEAPLGGHRLAEPDSKETA